MAQNVTVQGASYSDVPAVVLPKTGGGTATFTDTTIATNAAAAADIASGKLAYVNGSLITGTGSGGGGASPWTLIKSQKSAISYSSTSASTAVTLACGPAIYTANKIVWVHIRDTEGARNNYFYGSDAFFVNYYAGEGLTDTFASPAVVCLRYNNNAYSGTIGQYGVYGYSIDSTGSLIIRQRYNSTNSRTINSTYAIDVYTLDLPSGLALFD